MGEGERAIIRFRGAFRFLSNFYIEPDGTHVEGEFQREKTLDPLEREEFTGLSPTDAKALGRRVTLRKGWDNIRLNVMRQFVLKKFTEHASLREALLATGDAHLEEGNDWGDRFWGTVNGEGENHLGKILMQVRERLRVAR